MPRPNDSCDFAAAPRWVIRAKAVFDARGCRSAPGQVTIAVEAGSGARGTNLRTLAVGPQTDAGGAPVIDLPDAVLLPGFVNAHCHLDLTLVGPRPRPTTGGFSAWLEVIRRARPQTPADIEAAVRRGIDLSLAGGVVAVGDIAGCARTGPTLVPWRTIRGDRLAADGFPGLGGVSFLEFFAFGPMREASLERLRLVLEEAGPERSMLGLSPHAPYSVSLPAYRAALESAERLGLTITTHLAETLEERAFIAGAAGPQREFVEALGLWGEEEALHIGNGLDPVAHLAPLLARGPWLLAHLNDCSDDALGQLAATECSVAYCPRASAYFGAPSDLGPHRYRDMLARGINVCLGTDSIVNLLPEAAEEATGGISPLDDARLLHARDGTDPLVLLSMLTTRGARALGLDERAFVFTPGNALAGVVAVSIGPEADALPGVFAGCSVPRLLAWSPQIPEKPNGDPERSNIAEPGDTAHHEGP